MTILSVAYPLLPVGPDSGGGAEQVLNMLERGLVESGHQSIVIAAMGSQISSELVETPVLTSAITEKVRNTAQSAHREAIAATLVKYPVDLIHFHGLDFHTYFTSQRFPQLATLHLPVDWYPRCIFETPGLHLNCVSDTQARSAHTQPPLPVVMNGVDLDSFRPHDGDKSYLLWLGRICPEKGVDIALRVAHRLGISMIIAGPVHPFRDHQIYFAEHVQPMLDEKRLYIGAVGLRQKLPLFKDARCLLVPSLVAETSSLVVMEAFASGIPVIAYRSGALPEIVEHEKTGFVVDSEDEMAQAVDRLEDISPLDCRKTAETRFDSKRMVRDYLNLYKVIAA